MPTTARSLIQIANEFGTEEKCIAFLERKRWPEGVACLECGSKRISQFSTKESTIKRRNKTTGAMKIRIVPARHLYQCLECKHQFSATVGTIFNDTHLPLSKWFMAISIMCNAKKGVSAKQMQRDLDVHYRTAWHLCHRIRKAMEEGNIFAPMTGTVEIDETYVGGKYDRRRKRERWDKEPVFGIIERGGRVRAYHVPEMNRWNIYGKIKDNVSADAEMVVTDESNLYKSLGKHYAHAIINHSIKQYVVGNVHTNSIENFWSLFKRGVIGSFHKVSIKHLGRYLAEFSYRFNNRDETDMFSMVVAKLLAGSALSYEALTAKKRRRSSRAGKNEPTPF
jgi:transposase-like protein/DNA-directed RNA polymerase subunit RPC12/RpoP